MSRHRPLAVIAAAAGAVGSLNIATWYWRQGAGSEAATPLNRLAQRPPPPLPAVSAPPATPSPTDAAATAAPEPPPPATDPPADAASSRWSAGAGDPLEGWAGDVEWVDVPPPPPVRTEQYPLGPMPVNFTKRSAGMGGYLWNVTPFCVQNGRGWVWPADGSPPSGIPVPVELTRYVTPLPPDESALGSPAQVRWSPQPAYLFPLATATAKRDVHLFHWMWTLVAAFWARHDLAPRVLGAAAVYSQTTARPCCNETNMGRRVRATCNLCPGNVCHDARDGCSRRLFSRGETKFPLLALVSPEARPSEAFAAEPGAMVCHPWGVVGGADVAEHANCAVQGNRGSSKKRFGASCGADRLAQNTWRGAAELRRIGLSLFARQRPALTPAQRAAEPLRILIVNRTGARRIMNLRELRRWSKEFGKLPSIVQLEKQPAARQLVLATETDLWTSMHGSALAWSLFAKPGSTWIETISHGGGTGAPLILGRAKKALPGFGINKGRRVPGGETGTGYSSYGYMLRYSGAHHLGYMSGGSDRMCALESLDVAILRGKDSRSALPGMCICHWWKTCDTYFPRPVWKLIVDSVEMLRKGESPCSDGGFDCYVLLNKSHLSGVRYKPSRRGKKGRYFDSAD